jgi:hypothetical protein
MNAVLKRRRLLQTGALIAAAPWLSVGRAAEALLPTPDSLQQALASAVARGNPLIVMVSLDGCPYCRTVRSSYLLPLAAEQGLDIVQVDMQSARPLRDFGGARTTHDALIRQWGIRIAPTVMFFGEGGAEAAPRLVGASLPDFYGAYLDARIEQARKSLRR